MENWIRWTSCIHEAAHFVVALAVGFRPVEAWIGDQPITQFSHRLGPHDRAVLVVVNGGYIGERLFLSTEIKRAQAMLVPRNHEIMEGSDHRYMWDFARERFGLSGSAPEIERAEALAEQILSRNRPAVKSAAEELFATGKINSDNSPSVKLVKPHKMIAAPVTI